MNSFFLVALLLLVLTVVLPVVSATPLPPNTTQSGNVSAMALLYLDARYMPPNKNTLYHPDILQSIVGYTVPTSRNPKEQVIVDDMFDAVLFIGYDWKNGACFWPGSCKRPMDLTDWKDIMQLWLGTGTPAINTAREYVIGNVTKRKTSVQTKIFVTIPYPDTRQQNFGIVPGDNRRSLNFTKQADRLQAVRWWVKTVTAQFVEQHKKWRYVRLAGFYWFLEDVPAVDKPLLPIVGNIVRSAFGEEEAKRGPQGDYFLGSEKRQLKFMWIPYYEAAIVSVSSWRKLGFDFVTIQPNYAFRNVMNATIWFDTVNNLMTENECGVEMELPLSVRNKYIDYNATRSFDAYLNAAEVHGWTTGALKTFYYGDAYMDMALSTNKTVRVLYDRIHGLIKSAWKV